MATEWPSSWTSVSPFFLAECKSNRYIMEMVSRRLFFSRNRSFWWWRDDDDEDENGFTFFSLLLLAFGAGWQSNQEKKKTNSQIGKLFDGIWWTGTGRKIMTEFLIVFSENKFARDNIFVMFAVESNPNFWIDYDYLKNNFSCPTFDLRRCGFKRLL